VNHTTEIKLAAAGLELGENMRVLCPACQGGESRELSLSITLCEDASLKWQCFRAKCPMDKGGNGGKQVHHSSTPLVKKKRRVFEGKVSDMREEDKSWVKEHWGIEPEHWYYTPEYGGRIAMSVRSPKFVHRGWVLRDITGQARTKALTYIDEGQEGLSWYKTTPNAPTIVVEDIPSAVKASKYVNAVALLGTGIGLDRAIEIAANSTSVIMALDNDAISLSFKWARKYSLLWGDVSVLPLHKDIKDMKENDIKELLNE